MVLFNKRNNTNNNNNNHSHMRDDPNIHQPGATLRKKEYSPTSVGGIQPIQPVTLDISHTQLSRPLP